MNLMRKFACLTNPYIATTNNIGWKYNGPE